MASKDIIIFDYETGSVNAHTTQPTQLAAIALDGRTLRPKGTFNSEILPIINDEEAMAAGLDPLQDKALEITHKTREQLAKAPHPKVVWDKFCQFVDKYNWKGTPYFAPIPAGFNIIGFDLIIIDRMAKQYGRYDEAKRKNTLFSSVDKIDMMDNLLMWFEGDPNVKSRSMDSIRERTGMSKENAHDALQDVKDTANLLIKFLKTHRAVYKNLEIDGMFANGKGLYV